MKTLNQLRKSPSYKNKMKEFTSGKKKPRGITMQKVEEIAATYSFLCWKKGDYPSEQLLRALVDHDFVANEAQKP
jgi:hypothetical protein